MKLYDDLKWRGLIGQTAGEDIEEALNKGGLTYYLGVDPTGKSVHAGNLLTIMGAMRLSRAGHHPIILVGGGTGMIGDPSGKNAERNLLDADTTKDNASRILNQLKQLLPEATFVNNYDWLSSMNVITYLRDYGKYLTVNYMMAKESVKKRIETGISYTEFSYQVLQALDFLHLYRTHNCQLQVGGQDQWGNVTSGFELIRKEIGDEAKVYCLTFPLLLKPDGTKFGKTAGGAVWLDPELTSPYKFYQFWLQVSDEEVIQRLKQYTFLSKEEIDEIEAKWNERREERYAQKRLAEEVTKLVHKEEGLEEALRITNAVFNGDVTKLSAKEIEDAFKDAPITEVNEELNIVDLLALSKLAQSKSEARKLVQGGGISVNGTKITDIQFLVKKENAIDNTYTFIKKGKKNHALIKHE
ncbi:MAG: tyrosine--tRNA ligase [Gammaproteobacteria bacterium]|nr:tyrosine--tRNA ligase [Gammaproteobacteria bacterium]